MVEVAVAAGGVRSETGVGLGSISIVGSTQIAYSAGRYPIFPSGSRTLFQTLPSERRSGPTTSISVSSGHALILSSMLGVPRIYTPSPSVLPTRQTIDSGVGLIVGVDIERITAGVRMIGITVGINAVRAGDGEGLAIAEVGRGWVEVGVGESTARITVDEVVGLWEGVGAIDKKGWQPATAINSKKANRRSSMTARRNSPTPPKDIP